MYVVQDNNLLFYSCLFWRNKDWIGIIDEGLGFTIDTKVSVNSTPQYQVHNCKGKPFYVKANEA